MDDVQLRKLIRNKPGILINSIDDNMSPKLLWLEKRLDLNSTEILRKFVVAAPGVLSRSESTLEAKLNWLEKRLCIDPRRVATIIRQQPRLISVSVNNYESKATWLQERLQLSDEEVAKVLRKGASTLGLSVEDKIEPQLCWLQSRFGLDDEGLRSMVSGLPTLLGYHINNNIEPKMEVYADLLGEEESLRYLAKDPILLSYSLEKRIKPRLAQATELGMVVDKWLLQYLVKYTDKNWSNKIEKYKLKQLEESIDDFR